MKKDYISIKVILDNITQHPLLLDVSLERAVNYAQSFLRIVGVPSAFQEKTECILISQYRGVLPCDFHRIILVRGASGMFRATTDTFHMSNNKPDYKSLTYKILGGCIFTSIEKGEIEISYRAIAVDQDGFPLIPNDSIFIRALESYIKYQHFTMLFDMGKIHPLVYLNAQLEYAWNVGQVQSSMLMPSIDETYSLGNSGSTLLIRGSEHSKGFIDNGSPQTIKTH